mgnify:CR=1 FL=1
MSGEFVIIINDVSAKVWTTKLIFNPFVAELVQELFNNKYQKITSKTFSSHISLYYQLSVSFTIIRVWSTKYGSIFSEYM